MNCRIDDAWSYRGLRCIRLENGHLAVDVLPELGGNIFRLIDKARDHDLLWKSPRVHPHRADLHANFDDHWAGGWDEAFPGGAPSPNRYGDQLPYMGELWTQTATYEILEAGPAAVELALTIVTPITPARWVRRLRIERDSPVVSIRYRLEHTGHQPFDFNWGIHPVQASYDWPTLGSLDVRRALGPDAECFALHYLTELDDGWVAATDTEARRGFGLCFDRELFPVVWLWLVYGGWRDYYHAIAEPWTGYPSPLADAVAAGRARVLGPGEVLETEVTAVIYGGVASVSQLQADGSVEA
jgi:hypothetical protein